MFIPMASPVWASKRMYKFLPAKLTISLFRRANLQQHSFQFQSIKDVPVTAFNPFSKRPLTCWSCRKPLWWLWSHPTSLARLWPLLPCRLKATSPPDPWSYHQPGSCCGSRCSAAWGSQQVQRVRDNMHRFQRCLLNSPHLQRVPGILCWCSPPDSLLWLPEERETAYHPAEEGQPLLPALACSQWRSHSRYPSPGAGTEQWMKTQRSLVIRQKTASVFQFVQLIRQFNMHRICVGTSCHISCTHSSRLNFIWEAYLQVT